MTHNIQKPIHPVGGVQTCGARRVGAVGADWACPNPVPRADPPCTDPQPGVGVRPLSPGAELSHVLSTLQS
jgi:hypothetical protein